MDHSDNIAEAHERSSSQHCRLWARQCLEGCLPHHHEPLVALPDSGNHCLELCQGPDRSPRTDGSVHGGLFLLFGLVLYRSESRDIFCISGVRGSPGRIYRWKWDRRKCPKLDWRFQLHGTGHMTGSTWVHCSCCRPNQPDRLSS